MNIYSFTAVSGLPKSIRKKTSKYDSIWRLPDDEKSLEDHDAVVWKSAVSLG
jgi:hypothetical protein